MLNDKTFLAIIPARGGSKRLPHKNKLILGGKPLISWSIEAAQKTKYLDEIIVSSDDTEILNIAHKYGIRTLLRPENLASDTASTVDVIEHTLKNIDQDYDYIVLLQPTSPLRSYENIACAIELLINKNADAIISVCKVEHSPFWSNILPNDRNMDNFLSDEVLNKRGQDFEQYYRLNGAIYIIDKNKFLEKKSIFLKKNIFAYEMSQKQSIDIDTKLDFQIASAIISL